MAAIPGGVLGGVSVILYGVVGPLGGQIWANARADAFAPAHLKTQQPLLDEGTSSYDEAKS